MGITGMTKHKKMSVFKGVLELIIGFQFVALVAILATPQQHNKDVKQLPSLHTVAPKGVVQAPKGVVQAPPAPLTLKDKLSWCSNNKDCMSLVDVGYFEARGEDDVGVIAVMQVVLNRVDNKRAWKDNIKGVVYQPYQFSYIHQLGEGRVMYDRKQVDRIKVLAYDVLHKQVADVTGSATHYHAKEVTPYWANKLTYKKHIGSHIFYSM